MTENERESTENHESFVLTRVLKNEIIQFLRANYPDEADILMPLLRPSLRLKTTVNGLPGSQYSRFGGIPSMSSRFTWPVAPNGCPLSFLFQLRLEEVAGFEMDPNLPKTGMLYFFVLCETPERYPDSPGEYKIIYDPEFTGREFVLSIPQGSQSKQFTECSVTFHYSYNFPSYQDYEILQCEKDTGRDLFDAAGQTMEFEREFTNFEQLPDHRMFGGADAAQGSVVFHWARTKLGMNYPFTETDLETIGKQEEHWRLLLQIDFGDTSLGIDYPRCGLSGLGYFGITEESLRARDFDSALLVFQNT